MNPFRSRESNSADHNANAGANQSGSSGILPTSQSSPNWMSSTNQPAAGNQLGRAEEGKTYPAVPPPSSYYQNSSPNLYSTPNRRPQSSSYSAQMQDELYLSDIPPAASRGGQPQKSSYHFPPLQDPNSVPASLQPQAPPEHHQAAPTITFHGPQGLNGKTENYPDNNALRSPPSSLQPGISTPNRFASTRSGGSHSRSITQDLSNVTDNGKPGYTTEQLLGGESSTATTPVRTSHYTPKFPTGHLGPQSPLALDQIRPRANSTRDNENASAEAAIGSNCYLSQWPIYAYDWCKYPVPFSSNGSSSTLGRMAIGSYLESAHNHINIIDTVASPSENVRGGVPNIEYTKYAEATCCYPVTRIVWEPPSSANPSELLATSGDHLRLWSLPNMTTPQNASNTITRSSAVNQKGALPHKLNPLALLSNSKTSEHTAPLTSLDWNKMSPKLILTSSIDTTCTIWDIPTLTAKTQLIAHDKEVFDVRFCAHSVDVFVSCGADGSVRMFDLRSLEHSTIIYECNDKNEKQTQAGLAARRPLLRVATSPHETNLLATFAANSGLIRILDVRKPSQALAQLQGHRGAINAIEWSPTQRGVLASAADDCLVMTWDLLSDYGAAVDVPVGDIPSGSDPYGLSAASTPSSASTPSAMAQQQQQQPGGPAQAGAGGTPESAVRTKGPAHYWRSELEPVNLSWSPPYQGSSQGTDWIGVVGGRGLWSVKTGF